MSEQLLNMGIPPELVVIIIAMLPIFELRGALPVAINVLDFPWYYALFLALIGNMLPVPFILLFLEGIIRVLGKVSHFRRFFDWLFERTRRRSQIIQKYERIGLALFVAVPLPFTGAWTGAVAAVLLGFGFKHAMLAIGLGVLIAGVIITCLSLLGWWGAVIAGLALSALAVYSLWKMKV
jgi:uncharacterized membrane protein